MSSRKRIHSPGLSRTSSSSDNELPFKKAQIEGVDLDLRGGLSRKELSEMKVLLVGVGGVGSEILKNLLVVGFRQIDLIDLDTIEVSNLNRQFLFRSCDVGKAKAEVAKAAAERMVCGTQFSDMFSMDTFVEDVTSLDYKFFGHYRIVLNALDAQEPRRHVNRMCVFARVPLIESGTSGHLGNTSAIVPGLTECYECTEKPKKQMSYPTCTIRSTPSKMIHCVVWAKTLFNQLFNRDASAFEDDVGPENEEGQGVVSRLTTHEFAVRSGYDGQQIFGKLFVDDINVLLTMKSLWEKRKPPSEWTDDSQQQQQPNKQQHDHQSLKQTFLANLRSLHRRYEQFGTLIFDKNDQQMIEFVHAAANIRAILFGIEQESLFDVQHMAGAIIPAVATTNAITAGLAVLQALSILNSVRDVTQCGDRQELKHVFVNYKLLERSSQTVRFTRKPERKMIIGHQLISPFDAPAPNPNCPMCAKQIFRVRVDLETANVGDLRKTFQKNLELDEIEATTIDGLVFLFAGCSEKYEQTPLKNLRLKDGTVIFVEGTQVSPKPEAKIFQVVIDHQSQWSHAELELINN